MTPCSLFIQRSTNKQITINHLKTNFCAEVQNYLQEPCRLLPNYITVQTQNNRCILELFLALGSKWKKVKNVEEIWEGGTILRLTFPPKFCGSKWICTNDVFREIISCQWGLFFFAKGFKVSLFLKNCGAGFDKLLSGNFKCQTSTRYKWTWAELPTRHISLCFPPCYCIRLKNIGMFLVGGSLIKCRGRGNIFCSWTLGLTSSAQRGSRSFTESSQKVQSWNTHSSFHSRICGLLQLACCVWGLTGLQMHPTVSLTKEYSHQTSLWGMADDLARCVTHHATCWQASRFQLHSCTSDGCFVSVCL